MYTKKPAFLIKALIRDFYHYQLKRSDWNPGQEVSRITTEIEENGFAVVPGFLSPEVCRDIRSEVDELFSSYQGRLWQDSIGSDERFFGIDAKSDVIKDLFFRSALVNNAMDFYEKSRTKSMFTMAGRIKYAENNLGSGSGWHRDRVDFKQTKTILYLSDTGERNGPFQYIKYSHGPVSMLRDHLRYGVSLFDSRVTDEQANTILEEDKNRLATLTAPAGTLIIADVRGIHRGAPLLEGERYALTNYTWYDSGIPEHIRKMLIE
jgi:hypothetical protein